MKFESKYRTPDGIFEVDIDDLKEIGTKRKPPTFNYTVGGMSPKNATIYKVNVYNTYTKAFSTKQIYVNKDERTFFRGSKRRCESEKKYYIDELARI